MVGIGAGLVIVGAALEIVADVLGKMGNFSWEQIAKGLVTMGVALAELAIGLNFMKGTLGGSAAQSQNCWYKRSKNSSGNTENRKSSSDCNQSFGNRHPTHSAQNRKNRR